MFLDAQSSPFMPKFHRTVCGLSFCFAAFEQRFWERGAELALEQALVRKGVNFSLVGGAKGESSCRRWSLFRLSCAVDRSFGVVS